jgi:hypothetical protein
LGRHQSPNCYSKVRILHVLQGFASFINAKYVVLVSSSVAAVKRRDTHVLEHLAEEFNLTYTAFGIAISPQDGPSAGTLTLSDPWVTALEPAPVTPTGEDSAPWQLLSGTIKATFNAHRGLDGADNIFVSPGIMSGNSGGCTRPSRCAVDVGPRYVERGPQIQHSIGNSRATLSGTTTNAEEMVGRP